MHKFGDKQNRGWPNLVYFDKDKSTWLFLKDEVAELTA